ncbi:MAG: hypothetical protein FJZ05_02505 [Candidatus Nealsonbacteria bacterium]|nr:hypothetical protein [Candidatus Nealsonbacteria bacterium]
MVFIFITIIPALVVGAINIWILKIGWFVVSPLIFSSILIQIPITFLLTLTAFSFYSYGDFRITSACSRVSNNFYQKAHILKAVIFIAITFSVTSFFTNTIFYKSPIGKDVFAVGSGISMIRYLLLNAGIFTFISVFVFLPILTYFWLRKRR